MWNIHLPSDPVPVIGKDFDGSWTKPLSISEGSCYFLFFCIAVIICYGTEIKWPVSSTVHLF